MKKHLLLLPLTIVVSLIVNPAVGSENSVSGKFITISNITEKEVACFKIPDAQKREKNYKYIIQPHKMHEFEILLGETQFDCTIVLEEGRYSLFSTFKIEEEGVYKVNLGAKPKKEIPVFKCGSPTVPPRCSDENQMVSVAIVTLPSGRNIISAK